MSLRMSTRSAIRARIPQRLIHTSPALDPSPGPPPPVLPTHNVLPLSPPVSESAGEPSIPAPAPRVSKIRATTFKADPKYRLAPAPKPRPTIPSHLPPLVPASESSSSTLPNTIPSALSLLRSQSTPSQGIYILARLHSRTYILHPRDILTLPTLQPLKPPGTTLNLTRILEVGSREYAIRSPAADAKVLRKYLDWDARGLDTVPLDIARCEVTVLEHTRGVMMTRFKYKRRGGMRKTIRRKPGWTRLRVGDIILGDGDIKRKP